MTRRPSAPSFRRVILIRSEVIVGATSDQSGAFEGSQRAEDDRVTTIELFFDLVFVFTITQLTTLLFRHPSGTGVGQVAVLFGNL